MGTMATPDGRNAYEPLAEGCSPAHNADKMAQQLYLNLLLNCQQKNNWWSVIKSKMTPQMLSTEENKQN